jgi:hypothetical protein
MAHLFGRLHTLSILGAYIYICMIAYLGKIIFQIPFSAEKTKRCNEISPSVFLLVSKASQVLKAASKAARQFVVSYCKRFGKTRLPLFSCTLMDGTPRAQRVSLQILLMNIWNFVIFKECVLSKTIVPSNMKYFSKWKSSTTLKYKWRYLGLIWPFFLIGHLYIEW